MKGEEQITVYSGRGILSQSKGPVWMIGTACKWREANLRFNRIKSVQRNIM